MPIIKAINSHPTLKKCIEYITKEEKTDVLFTGTHNMESLDYVREMEDVKHEFNKLGNQTHKHYVISFAPQEQINVDTVFDFTKSFIEQTPEFKDYQIVYACHTDKKHMHAHIVVNSVSWIDGKKFDSNKTFLARCKKKLNKLSEKYHLNTVPIPEHPTTVKSKDLQKTKGMEHRLNELPNYVRGQSWLLDMAVDFYMSLQKVNNMAELTKEMNLIGYELSASKNRKNITVIDSNGMKARTERLAKTFNAIFTDVHADWTKETIDGTFQTRFIEKEFETFTIDRQDRKLSAEELTKTTGELTNKKQYERSGTYHSKTRDRSNPELSR